MVLGSTKSPKESIAKAFEAAQKSLSANPVCAVPYITLSSCYLLMRRHDEAIAASERAVTLDPNFAAGHMIHASNLTYVGRAKDALAPIQTMFRLDAKPYSYSFAFAGWVYYHNGMYEEAVSILKKGLEVEPNSQWLHLRLAASYSALGREKEARAETAEVLRLIPNMTLSYLSKTLPYKNQSDLDSFLNDLRKAGLK